MKSAWLKLYEDEDYKVKCEKCRTLIFPEQLPFAAALCVYCWAPGAQAQAFWSSFFAQTFAAAKLNRNYQITTRSASGGAMEIIARVFRRLPPHKDHQAVYADLKSALVHLRHGCLDKAQFEEWRARMLEAIAEYEKSAPPVVATPRNNPKRRRAKPGQLSLFGGDE